MSARDTFDNLTRLCEEMTGRPWDGTIAHLDELSDRQATAALVLNAHADWLADIRHRVLDSGRDWNTRTCREQSRRDGDLAAPPEWIGELSERLTPERLLTR